MPSELDLKKAVRHKRQYWKPRLPGKGWYLSSRLLSEEAEELQIYTMNIGVPGFLRGEDVGDRREASA